MGSLHFIDRTHDRIKWIPKSDFARQMPKLLQEWYGDKNQLFAIFWSDPKNAHLSTFFSEPSFVRALNTVCGEKITVLYAEPGDRTFEYEADVGYRTVVQVKADSMSRDESMWGKLQPYFEGADGYPVEEGTSRFPCISFFELEEREEGTFVVDAYFFSLLHDIDIRFEDFHDQLLEMFADAAEAWAEMDKNAGEEEWWESVWKKAKKHGKNILRGMVYKKIGEKLGDVLEDAFSF